MRLLSKYEPETLEEFTGNKATIDSITTWMNSGKIRDQALILTGGIGTGKTLLINLVLKKFGYESHSFQSIDLCKKVLHEKIKLIYNTFFSKKNILIIDNIEDLSYVTISEIRKAANIPVIFIGSKISSKLSNKLFFKVEMKKIYKKELLSFVKKIVSNEKIKITVKTINSVIDNNEDIRSILIYLSDITFSSKDELFDENTVVKTVFKNPKTFEFLDDVSSSYTVPYLHENYTSYPVSLKEMCEITESFSAYDTWKNEGVNYPSMMINSVTPKYNIHMYKFRHPVLNSLALKTKPKKNIISTLGKSFLDLDTIYFLESILTSPKRISEFEKITSVPFEHVNKVLLKKS